MKNKCLITGSSGFLGQYVVQELIKSSEVFCLGRKKNDLCKTFEYSLLDSNINFGLESFNEVYHIAGLAHKIPKTENEKKQFLDVNVKGTQNLLSALDKCNNPINSFVFISSVSVYGLENGINVSEEFPRLAKDIYGISKIQAEDLILEWGEKHGIKVGIARLPLIAGKNPPGNLGNMIQAIKNGKYFRIGEGNARKSIVLASDIAKILPVLGNKGGIYNFTDGHHPTFHELEDAITSYLKLKNVKSIPISVANFGALIGELSENILNIKLPLNKRIISKITSSLTFSDEKAREMLGWKPRPIIQNINELFI